MKNPRNHQRKCKNSSAGPYHDLYIYYLEGRVNSEEMKRHRHFIGNWEEDNFSFLFFSGPARRDIENLLRSQPHLAYIDSYHMPYDQWQGETFKAFDRGDFRIIPPWEQPAAKSTGSKIHILLDPGVVFGTGTHATTGDCLEAVQLAAGATPHEKVLDLGTGTGLLALAAAKLGCRSVLAVELNLLAAATAEKNVRLNQLEHKVAVVQGRAEDFIDIPADLVIANIHYSVMQQLVNSPGFLNKKCFILSGLLRSEAKAAAERLARLQTKIIKTWTHDGIWHTFYGKMI